MHNAMFFMPPLSLLLGDAFLGRTPALYNRWCGNLDLTFSTRLEESSISEPTPAAPGVSSWPPIQVLLWPSA